MNPAEYAVERMAMADLAVQALAQEYAAALAEIDWLKSDLYHAIQALHCSAPNELMSVEEIRAWLEIRNTLSDKYKEAT